MKELLLKDNRISWKAITCIALGTLILRAVYLSYAFRKFNESNVLKLSSIHLAESTFSVFFILVIWAVALKRLDSNSPYFNKIVIPGLLVSSGLLFTLCFSTFIRSDIKSVGYGDVLILCGKAFIIGLSTVAITDLLTPHIKNKLILYYVSVPLISILFHSGIFPAIEDYLMMPFYYNRIPGLTAYLILEGLIVLFLMRAFSVEYILKPSQEGLEDEINSKIKNSVNSEIKESLYKRLTEEYPQVSPQIIIKAFVTIPYESDIKRIEFFNWIVIGCVFISFILGFEPLRDLDFSDRFSWLYFLNSLFILLLSVFKLYLSIILLSRKPLTYIVLGLITIIAGSFQLWESIQLYPSAKSFSIIILIPGLINLTVAFLSYHILSVLYPNYRPFYLKKDSEGNFVI